MVKRNKTKGRRQLGALSGTSIDNGSKGGCWFASWLMVMGAFAFDSGRLRGRLAAFYSERNPGSGWNIVPDDGNSSERLVETGRTTNLSVVRRPLVDIVTRRDF